MRQKEFIVYVSVTRIGGVGRFVVCTVHTIHTYVCMILQCTEKEEQTGDIIGRIRKKKRWGPGGRKDFF